VRHLINNKIKEKKMKLTEKQIIAIIKEKRISQCSKAEKEQVMDFAFGSDYITSDDKGSKKVYSEK
tara:strand:+ start:419 stop:616 length:198 start_codon:yes stop_codon:yes gene_type:complete